MLVNKANERKSQKELIDIAFDNVNAFKRARALEKVEKRKGDYNKATYHRLRQYELFDELELTLRAIQGNQRHLDNVKDDME